MNFDKEPRVFFSFLFVRATQRSCPSEFELETGARPVVPRLSYIQCGWAAGAHAEVLVAGAAGW